MNSDLFRLEISASVVAWYGAIVATVGILVSLYNVLRDRARIKIKYQRDMKIVGPRAVYDPNKIYFNITVINKGRRPVNITKAAIRAIGEKRKYALLADSFSAHRNRVLNESNPTTEFMMEQVEDWLANAWFICVYDATGRGYRKFVHPFLPLSKLWHGFKRKVKGLGQA
jgi:hypothetical protein